MAEMGSSRRPPAPPAAVGPRPVFDAGADQPLTAAAPDAVRAWVARSCAAQEIPVLVSDATVLGRVVAIARLSAADVGTAPKPKALRRRRAPLATPTDRASARGVSGAYRSPSVEAAP